MACAAFGSWMRTESLCWCCEYEGQIPEDSVIETDANRAGNTKGGASIEYAVTSQTVKDDKGRVSKTITTDETVKFKTGILIRHLADRLRV